MHHSQPTNIMETMDIKKDRTIIESEEDVMPNVE